MIVPRTPNIIAIAVSEEPIRHVSGALDMVTDDNCCLGMSSKTLRTKVARDLAWH
jgi:hypothetical protein